MSSTNGLPCYLQASEQGQRLYHHHGFEPVDTVEFDLSMYGLKGVERMTEMIREPSNSRNTEAKAQNSRTIFHDQRTCEEGQL